MRRIATLLVTVCLLVTGSVFGAGQPAADEIARQVDFVNRFGAVRNVTYGTDDGRVVVLDLAESGRLFVNTLERWRRNDYANGEAAARDLVIFRSGKLRGTGILVTDYRDQAAGRMYAIWLPSLRKVRRFSEPDPADSWGNSNLTYGDIYTRRPDDEAHELLASETFDDCLGVVQLADDQRDRQTRWMPQADCSMRGRPVYRLRSRPHRANPVYDERIVWVDAETYADYRSMYYRNGEVVKVIDKSWRSMGMDDPRAQYWVYWYARTEATGQQGMTFVPPDKVRWNDDLDPDLWTEGTLRRIRP